jgi:hypothetical protein
VLSIITRNIGTYQPGSQRQTSTGPARQRCTRGASNLPATLPRIASRCRWWPLRPWVSTCGVVMWKPAAPGTRSQGRSLHTAEATGSKPVTPTTHFRRSGGVRPDRSSARLLRLVGLGTYLGHAREHSCHVWACHGLLRPGLRRPGWSSSRTMRHCIAVVLGHSGGRSKPKRRRGWLHCLVDHRQQLGRQRVQVHLLAQPGAERLDGLGRVVAAPVEPAVDHAMLTVPPGLPSGNACGASCPRWKTMTMSLLMTDKDPGDQRPCPAI